MKEQTQRTDIKCKFYDENVCVEHCDMTEEQLWEYANDPDPDRTDCEQWRCDKEDDMLYAKNVKYKISKEIK